MTRKNIPFEGKFPLSEAVLHNQAYVLEVSGQIGIKNGVMEEGVEEQTKQALELVKNCLSKIGWNLSHITRVRVYLVNMDDYATMNAVYSQYFPKDYPARTAVVVKELPAGALVEIECTAAGDEVAD